MTKVAVILSGSGYLDGAEIRESVFTLLALDQKNIDVNIFAPNISQHHVINHLNGEEAKETRNVLVESARIARGNIQDLNELNPSSYQALILPGGFGVAKNLSKFAFEGAKAPVNEKLSEIVKTFHKDKKPIGAICISPAIIASILGDRAVEVTIGNDEGTAAEIEKTGAKHFPKAVSEIHIDKTNKVVSTPAYMFHDGKLSDIFQGIKSCVDSVIDLID